MVDLTYIIKYQLETDQITLAEAQGFQEETERFIKELTEANKALEEAILEKAKIEARSILAEIFRK